MHNAVSKHFILHIMQLANLLEETNDKNLNIDISRIKNVIK